MYVDRSAGVSRVQVERLLGEASMVVQRRARLLPWGTSSFCLLAIVELRGSALGFRNLTNYIAPALLETGGFRPRLHPAL